jgi:hypothetical protein
MGLLMEYIAVGIYMLVGSKIPPAEEDENLTGSTEMLAAPLPTFKYDLP